MDVVQDLRAVGRADLAAVGGKAANLGELLNAGLPVPSGFVLTTEAYAEFVAASSEVAAAVRELGLDGASTKDVRAAFVSAPVPDAIRTALAQAYAGLGSGAVAVRSSATAEDLAEASFAGQQDTLLNVRGLEPLLDAVRACWASLWTARAVDYRARRGIAADDVSLAVVVQTMVEADASGVMFTANPSTGRRDETVLSAAWGLGESVVGGTVSTDDLVVERATGRVTSLTVADKALRTVLRPPQDASAGGTVEEPVPADLRSQPVLDDASAAELNALGERATAHFGAPQDLEWARANGMFWIVQSRPITALPPAEAPPPTDWTVAHPKAMYVRGSIVEQLPDPLTPLFAELVDGSVTRSLRRVMDELIGPGAVGPDDVSFPTVNGYAYYCYGTAAMLRLTLQTYKALPVLSLDGPRSGVRRWRERAHPAYAEVVAGWQERDLTALHAAELLDGVRTLLDAGTEYYTSVQTVIPLAAAGETLLTLFYDRLVRRPGDPAAATFLLGYPSAPIRADQSLFDLATWARGRPGLAGWLTQRATPEVVAALATAPDAAPEQVDPEAWAEWTRRFRAHLGRFGHAVYNLDFANPVAADEPGPVVDTLRFYLRGEGVDPYERERRSVGRREQASAQVLQRLDPVRRAVFARLLRRAQAAAPIREDALADIGLAWPRLRSVALELGRRLVAAGAVTAPDDVFWLTTSEVLAALAPDTTKASYAGPVEQRREVWRGQRRATPPQLLPQGRWFEALRSMMPAASETQTGDVIHGLTGSAGRVTAPARVLAGPADFGRFRPGEVLVASITTPAWTPLFALAAGVVTDIGGPLSHSSIVAREYGIPAVLGTGVATRRIPDGAEIVVDGDAGTVRLASSSEPATEPASDHRGRTVAVLTLAAVGAAVLLRSRRSGRNTQGARRPGP